MRQHKIPKFVVLVFGQRELWKDNTVDTAGLVQSRRIQSLNGFYDINRTAVLGMLESEEPELVIGHVPHFTPNWLSTLELGWKDSEGPGNEQKIHACLVRITCHRYPFR
jgi:hypothetical protein